MPTMKDCKYIVHVNDEKVTWCENKDALMMHLSTLPFNEIRECTIFSAIGTSDSIDLKNVALRLQEAQESILGRGSAGNIGSSPVIDSTLS